MSTVKPTQHDQHAPITYSQLLRFFLPLGIMPFLIASTHTIVNAALARLPLPELSIAIFAVVKGLFNAIKAPDLMARQTAVSLIDDRHSYQVVMRFVWILCAIFLIVLLGVAFTPAGGWILRNLLGLTDPDQIALAYAAMRIAAFLPIVETLRNGFQGLSISLERTRAIPVGTLIRLAGVCLFLWWAVSTQAVSGVVAASLTWTVGIGIEAVLIVAYLWMRFGSVTRVVDQMPPRNNHQLRTLDVFKFFAPLGMMMVLTGALQPIIQGGLARGPSPTRTLAAFGVAWGLMFIISGPTRQLHQASLVYTDGMDDPNWRTVRRFALAFGGLLSLATLAIVVSPVGFWLMHEAIAVSEEVTRVALPVLGVFAAVPLVRAWREVYWGVLMHKRRTSMIGGAKAANLTAVVLLLLLLMGPLQASVAVSPAVVGALVYIAGELAETLLIWRYAVRRKQTLRRVPAPSYSAAD